MSKLLPWIPAAGVMAVAFILSSIPGSGIPYLFSFQDTAVHVIIYAALGFFVYPALRSSLPMLTGRQALFSTLGFCVLYGISDEFHQSFVPGRTASLFDVMINSAGGFIGVLFRGHNT